MEDLLPPTDNVTGVVAVLSGGLDSTTLTYALVDKYGKDKVSALSFMYGQKQSKELDLAAVTCKKLGIAHKIIDISFLGDIVSKVSANIGTSEVKMPTIKDVLGDPQPPTYVPFRNMILNSIAFSYAEVNECNYIATGLQIHDVYGYWDTSKAFVDSMNNVAKNNRMFGVEMIAPFASLSKKDEIEIGDTLNVPYEDTLTCYNPSDDGKSCGG